MLSNRIKFWVIVSFIVVAAVFTLSLSVSGHSVSEVEAWFEEWEHDYTLAWLEWKTSDEWELSPEVEDLIVEYQGMMERHPAWGWDHSPVPSLMDEPEAPAETDEVRQQEADRIAQEKAEREAAERQAAEEAKQEAAKPAPEPESKPAPSKPVDRSFHANGDVERWRGLVAQYFPKNTDAMLCIMQHESGGNPNAYNAASGVRGLFQVQPKYWSKQNPDALYDPEFNVKTARHVFDEQGYHRAWPNTSRKCGL